MTHQSTIHHWKKEAEGARDRAFRFFLWLKTLHPRRVDRLAKGATRRVFRAVDCVACARCCRTLKPDFRPKDIQAAGAYLGLSAADFTEKYLEKNEQGNWQTNELPCPFLAETGHCGIYPARPADCRDYPHTDRPGFTRRSWSHAENAATCPAVFAILERMMERLGWREEG